MGERWERHGTRSSEAFFVCVGAQYSIPCYAMLRRDAWRQWRVAHTNRRVHGTIRKRETRGIHRGENGGRMTLMADSCQTPTATSRVTSMENDRVTFNCMCGHATKARTRDEDKRVMARTHPTGVTSRYPSLLCAAERLPREPFSVDIPHPTHTHRCPLGTPGRQCEAKPESMGPSSHPVLIKIQDS
jgi:hypothetical protein